MAGPPTPNSATGGYLTPQPPPPLYDDALEDFFHDVIAGIIGFTTDAQQKLIRPRWQPNPPNLPPFATDWVAFGIVDYPYKDWDAFQEHLSDAYDDAGATRTQQDEELVFLFSFYGPNARALCSQFEDGIKLAQNREVLETQGIKWKEAAMAHRVPSLLKDTWVNRIDQRHVFRRRIVRQYAVLNIMSAEVTLDNEHYKTEIDINPPSP